MFAALKDLITAIAAIAVLAYSTGQRGWLWKQIVTLRREVLIGNQKDWGCPSIFDKFACKKLL